MSACIVFSNKMAEIMRHIDEQDAFVSDEEELDIETDKF